MGWVKLTELNDRICTGIRFNYDEANTASDSGNYNFSRQEDVQDPAFGTWGSAFRFDVTARNVCDPAVNGGADVKYTPTADGQYNQVTVSNGVVEWMWSEPVYYWGFGSRNAVEDTFDPTPYAADYIYALVDDGNDDGNDDGGNTDSVTIADNLNRIIQAKADIKSAIEGKGVVVGDGTIDTYADKISAIPQETNQSKWIIPDGTKFVGSDWSSLDASSWDVSNVTNMDYVFSSCDKLTSLDVSDWDVSKVTSMYLMFDGCKALTSLDLSNWRTSNVTSMSQMFNGCEKLTSIIGIEDLDVSKVDSMIYMFDNCKALTSLDLSSWDVGSVTNMLHLFSSCYNLNSLDLSSWDVSNVTSMSEMFFYCLSLTSLDLSSWDVGKVTVMNNMFSNCLSLTSLNLTSWDLSVVLGVTDMFKSSNELTNLQFGNNLKTSISFSYCTQLTVESLLSIINGLYNFTEAGQIPTSSQGKLTLGSTNLAKLTDNQKAIATDKGWVLS